MGQRQSQGNVQNGPAPLGPGTRTLTILHFNDVYNIEPSDTAPVSGAARLAGHIKSESGNNPLVLFSGDAFSPSCMSTVTLGSHMPPVLNTFGIHAACIGNHDFDLGLDTCRSLVQQCNFPWMMSNVRDKETGQLLGGLHETLLIEHEGVRVGLMGLVEAEWLDTLAALDPDQLDYTDFVHKGEELAAKLRAEGAELVVALTHMREPNDRRLASSVPAIDMVLGGHDHHYVVDTIAPHGVLLAKSGTDFREMTRITVTLPAAAAAASSGAASGPGSTGTDTTCQSPTDGGATPPQPSASSAQPAAKPTFKWERVEMKLDSPQHPATDEVVAGFADVMGAKLSEEVGHTACDLDARFQTIRSQESNMGNLVCDILRGTTGADIVIVNSGTLRSDQVHAAGALCVRDIVELLPMPDSMVVLQATGAQVLEVLENGVSQVPRLEGRFPQVSGVRFSFDSRKPAGSRIVPGSVAVLKRQAGCSDDDEAGACSLWVRLEPDQQYKVAVKSYMAEGKDGYDVLQQCKVLVSEEEGVVVAQALRNHFRSLAVLTMWDPKITATAVAQDWLGRVRSKGGPGTNTTSAAGTTDAADAAAVAAAAGDGTAPAAGRTASAASAATAQPQAGPAPEHQGGKGGPERSLSSQGLERSLSSQCLERSLSSQRMASRAGHSRARMLHSLPTRTRLVAGGTGLCVLSVKHQAYVVNPVVEGRMVDVAAQAEHPPSS